MMPAGSQSPHSMRTVRVFVKLVMIFFLSFRGAGFSPRAWNP
jgi:hypothetical protein